MEAHTAAGKLQGLAGDAVWYEAAFVVGITNAMNVVADSLDHVASFAPVDDARPSSEVAALFSEVRAFY